LLAVDVIQRAKLVRRLSSMSVCVCVAGGCPKSGGRRCASLSLRSAKAL
jgi:hypothetical protein